LQIIYWILVVSLSIFAARQVLTLAGKNDNPSSLLAPAYFNHVRYGLYYNDLIIPAAQTNGLRPTVFVQCDSARESLRKALQAQHKELSV